MISNEELEQVKNTIVFDSFIKAMSVLKKHKKILVSVSGGSDSDIVLDIIEKCKTDDNEVHYVWFDTGLEYQATKNHLDYLEKRYGITIKREKAIKPIPTCCREYGQPFISKRVSDLMGRLQKHGFKWEDKTYDELSKEYQNCNMALKWWTSWYTKNGGAEKGKSRFDIDQNKWLKQFIIMNPPTFSISSKCCTYAKKNVAKKHREELNADLDVIGIRKAEGGLRASLYHNCYAYDKQRGVDVYRPIFWYLDEDKKYYENHFGIVHSECYTKYGLKRTGCVGCPYGRDIDNEMKCATVYEPNLAKACENIFRESYEYTRAYRAFYAVMQEKEKHEMEGQTTIYD